MKPRISSVICCLLYCFLEICRMQSTLSFVFLKRKRNKNKRHFKWRNDLRRLQLKQLQKSSLQNFRFRRDSDPCLPDTSCTAAPINCDSPKSLSKSASLPSYAFVAQVTDTKLAFGRHTGLNPTQELVNFIRLLICGCFNSS